MKYYVNMNDSGNSFSAFFLLTTQNIFVPHTAPNLFKELL